MTSISIIVLSFPSHIKLFILDLAASRPRCVIIETFQKCGSFWCQTEPLGQDFSAQGTKKYPLITTEFLLGTTLATGVLETALWACGCGCCVRAAESLAQVRRSCSIAVIAQPSNCKLSAFISTPRALSLFVTFSSK